MTNWDDIKEGDRVKVTGHGETHEFTVQKVFEFTNNATKGIKGNHSAAFFSDEGWVVEVIEPPLPDVWGLYATKDWDGLDHGLWELDAGEWYEMYLGEWTRRPERAVPRDLKPLVMGERK